MRNSTLALLIPVLLAFFFPAHAHAASINDEVCNPKAEQLVENRLQKCRSQKQRSTKSWKSLETAKGDIEFHLKGEGASQLADYLDCDATDPDRDETQCKGQLPEISKSDLQKLIYKIAKRVDKGLWKWREIGADKDHYLLCDLPSDAPSAMHRPSYHAICEEDGAPLIEIRKSPSGGYSISGVAL